MNLKIDKIFHKTIRSRMTFFIVGDILLIILSVYLAFLLRFDANIPSQYLQGIIPATALLTLVFTLPIFYFQKLYFFTWAYVSTHELISLIKSVVVSFALVGVVILIFRDSALFLEFPRSTLFIAYFLIFLFASLLRFSKRIYLELFPPGSSKEKQRRTLIVGAGDAGEQILRSISSSHSAPYLPICFVDDNKLKQGSLIHNIKVLGGIDEIPRIVKAHHIEEMIIALPSASSSIIKIAVEVGRNAGLQKIKIAPSITEIINGEVSFGSLREVQVEDLLGRDPVSLDKTVIEDFIRNKIILITGAAGSIGSELSRQVANFNPSLLVLLDQDETGIFNVLRKLKNQFPGLRVNSVIGNIQDSRKVEQVFQRFHPNVVFHAAAYKHVPLMEEHFDEAIKNNIFGTKIVADAALRHKIEKFVFISCLDEKTKILTNEGLKRWDQVKSGMKTFSLNRKGEIEENEIETAVSQKYLGPMFQIKTRSIDMLVTPNHKMVIQLPNNSAKIIEEEASETAKRSVVYIPKGKWEGINEEWFSLPFPTTDIRHPLRNSPAKVKTADILYILGIFIGDGFLNSGYKRRDERKTDNYGSVFLDIPEKDKARKRILVILDRMGIAYKCYKGRAGEHIYFSSRALAQVFSTCGKGSRNKTIPDWALKYSPKLLQFLLDGLIDSDGYRNKSHQKLTTISPKLIEKCAELAAKLSLHFTISIQRNKGAMIGNRKISPSQSFIGIFSKIKHRAFNKKHCKLVNYQGIIWCVRVKNNHNFLAERNGKFFFTGNTDKAINPTSVMGATKRVGEMVCQVLNQKNATKFISVRFGNVLDSRGSVIPIFRKQIKNGGPVEVTHPDMKRYFMVTSESCLLVMQSGAMGQGGEVFVLDMGQPIKILDLAKEMIQLSGFKPDHDIPIVFTGIRPGEKFFEEILTAEEGIIATQNQKIFQARLSQMNEEEINKTLEKLYNAINNSNQEQLITALKDLVPIHSNNNIS